MNVLGTNVLKRIPRYRSSVVGRPGARGEVLPPGKRRARLLAAVEKMFEKPFDERILPWPASM
jgi:hypothetical protein